MTSPHPLAAWIERSQTASLTNDPRYRRRRVLALRRARRSQYVSRTRYS